MEHFLNLRKLAAQATPKDGNVRVLYNRMISAFKGARGVLNNDEINDIARKLEAEHKAVIKHLRSLKVPVKRGKVS